MAKKKKKESKAKAVAADAAKKTSPSPQPPVEDGKEPAEASEPIGIAEIAAEALVADTPAETAVAAPAAEVTEKASDEPPVIEFPAATEETTADSSAAEVLPEPVASAEKASDGAAETEIPIATEDVSVTEVPEETLESTADAATTGEGEEAAAVPTESTAELADATTARAPAEGEKDGSSAVHQTPPATTATAAAPPSPAQAERPPVDIKELTIRNLDTGEEYVIGENDPDFEFDTFALDGGPDTEGEAAEEQAAVEANEDWLDKIYNWIFNKTDKKSSKPEGRSDGKARTPYTKLSSFKFRRELGKGAFGRVLLAESKIDGQLYAMKIISKANMRSSDKRQAKAERDILHAMSHQSPHPFTTGLKFAFQSVNNLYIGMEYLPGGNLRQLIQKFGSLPEEWVRFYSAELVLAISHLHALHVLYRDIKPHNVMIDAKGHLILIDYGLSKQEVSHPRGAQSLVGTPDYSAPEVLKTGVYRIENAEREKKGKKKKSPPPDGSSMGYGKAADWWSVGVMIFEMLSGLPPFRGPDLRQTYQNVLFADLKFTPVDKFSEASKVLLKGMIQRDPSLRWGAWSNPPTDIMESDFFTGVDWEAMMEKRSDGPYLPPEEPLLVARRKKELAAAAAEVKRIEEEEAHLEGWEEDCNETVPLGDTVKPRVTRVNPRKGAERVVPPSEGSTMDQSELLHIRESIFDASGVQNANKIPDWSFVDAATLGPVASRGNTEKSAPHGSSKKNLNKL